MYAIRSYYDEVQRTNIQSKKTKNKSGCLNWFIIGAVLLIIIYSIGSNGDDSSSSSSTSTKKFLAYNYAEDFVEKKINVITSYSIHYTKLYEEPGPGGHRGIQEGHLHRGRGRRAVAQQIPQRLGRNNFV